MKDFFKKPAVFAVSAVVALAVIGVGYACYEPPTYCQPSSGGCGFSWVVSNDDGRTTNISGYYPIDRGDNNGGPTEYDRWGSASSNDPSATQDPGCTVTREVKDVGKTTVCLEKDWCQENADLINVKVWNGYPQYLPTVFFGISNKQSYNIKIKSITINNPHPEAISVELCGIYIGQSISACRDALGWLSIKVLQPAVQDSCYTFTVSICLVQVQCDKEGTIGFWKNWCSHNTYSRTQIESWLRTIDTACRWLGPTNVSGMVTYMNNASAGTSQQKFLGQYLALRLNVASGRKSINNTYDITAKDPGNYLGLGSPSNASLSQIFSSIEAKYLITPNSNQYLIMKDVLDFINNISG